MLQPELLRPADALVSATTPSGAIVAVGAYDSKRRPRPARTYVDLEAAFEFFNRALFDGRLPPCLITMQRARGSYGYFSAARFVNVADTTEVTDEIALNPVYFDNRPLVEVLSTLAHEMAHLWQHHHGKPSRGRYHNSEWARTMRHIGLMPSDTGKPGGKATGERVSHYIVAGGRFERASADYFAGNTAILYQDSAYRERADSAGAVRERLRKNASKTRYVCPNPDCDLHVWAKRGVRIRCEDCDELLLG